MTITMNDEGITDVAQLDALVQLGKGVVFTGKNNTDKIYYRHTGHPGGVKSTTPEKVLGGRFPERVLEKAVERMLPKESPLARKQMTHLRLFAGSQHDHEAQQPETIDFKSASPKNTRSV